MNVDISDWPEYGSSGRAPNNPERKLVSGGAWRGNILGNIRLRKVSGGASGAGNRLGNIFVRKVSGWAVVLGEVKREVKELAMSRVTNGTMMVEAIQETELPKEVFIILA